MFYAMQEYCTAATIARRSCDTQSTSIFLPNNEGALLEDPIVVALLRWSVALREVAAESNPTDRAALEAIADEKQQQANSIPTIRLSLNFQDYTEFSANKYDDSAMDVVGWGWGS
jgi:hypothetical protein